MNEEGCFYCENWGGGLAGSIIWCGVIGDVLESEASSPCPYWELKKDGDKK